MSKETSSEGQSRRTRSGDIDFRLARCPEIEGNIAGVVAVSVGEDLWYMVNDFGHDIVEVIWMH